MLVFPQDFRFLIFVQFLELEESDQFRLYAECGR